MSRATDPRGGDVQTSDADARKPHPASTRTGIDVLAGLVTLWGILFGFIPLLRAGFGDDVGVTLSWVPGAGTAVGQWLIPLLAVATWACGMLALLLRDGESGAR